MTPQKKKKNLPISRNPMTMQTILLSSIDLEIFYHDYYKTDGVFAKELVLFSVMSQLIISKTFLHSNYLVRKKERHQTFNFSGCLGMNIVKHTEIRIPRTYQ